MKLITWNIQWGGGVDGRVDMDRIVADAQRFTDFDVLYVQEVSAGHRQLPGCDGSDQFEQLAARLPAYEPVAGVATDVLGTGGRRRRFGNMLFSRLPLRQVFRHLLPWPVEAGVMSMQRVPIDATLDSPLGLLRVTTTHLEYYSARQRAAQIDRLRELHRRPWRMHVRCGPAARRMVPWNQHLERQRRFLSVTSSLTIRITPGCLRQWSQRHRRIAMLGNLPTLAFHTRRRLACTTKGNGQARPSPSTSSASALISRVAYAMCGSTTPPTRQTTSRCCWNWPETMRFRSRHGN